MNSSFRCSARRPPSATRQLEAIVASVDERARTLIVQRTGWGKSLVYFIASKILREHGAGPTLLISPLLSLMRNQVEAAERIGIRVSSAFETGGTWAGAIENLHAGWVPLFVRVGEDVPDGNRELIKRGGGALRLEELESGLDAILDAPGKDSQASLFEP
jgi:hypothetical protein